MHAKEVRFSSKYTLALISVILILKFRMTRETVGTYLERLE